MGLELEKSPDGLRMDHLGFRNDELPGDDISCCKKGFGELLFPKKSLMELWFIEPGQGKAAGKNVVAKLQGTGGVPKVLHQSWKNLVEKSDGKKRRKRL